MNPEPFRIEPTFSPRIWGARSLAPVFPDKTNLPEPIGEAWLTDVNCRIATGPFAGKTLGEAWRAMPAGWRGARLANVSDFPLLVKFLFPTDKLSIQVHPDDAYASVHEQAAGGRGKTEMWHIISADPGAHVLLGLQPGTTKEKFLAALASGTVESLFNRVPVSAGDTIFVPARTGHAICPGMVLCEVQEYSDLTYRVYDYNRLDARGNPRELHVAKALDVMSFDSTTAAKLKALPIPTARGRRLLLVACPYFAVERTDFDESIDWYPSLNSVEIVVCLSGPGKIAWEEGEAAFHKGDCWLLPANMPKRSFVVNGSASFIRAYVPDVPSMLEEWSAAKSMKRDLPQVIFPL